MRQGICRLQSENALLRIVLSSPQTDEGDWYRNTEISCCGEVHDWSHGSREIYALAMHFDLNTLDVVLHGASVYAKELQKSRYPVGSLPERERDKGPLRRGEREDKERRQGLQCDGRSLRAYPNVESKVVLSAVIKWL